MFTGPIPPGIGNMFSLRKNLRHYDPLFGMHYLRLTLPFMYFCLVYLNPRMNSETLWLHSNALTGPIPLELANLFDLSKSTPDNNWKKTYSQFRCQG